MTGLVEVVVVVAGSGRGLVDIVGGASVGDDCTPSELVLLGK